MSPLITLSQSEEAYATEIGRQQQFAFERTRWHDRRPGIKGLDAHILGAKCELAVSKYRGVKWDPIIFELKDFSRVHEIYDVGDWEVRGTEYRNAHLPVKSKDKDDAPYILVIKQGSTYQLVGWIIGKDGKQQKWAKYYGYGLTWITYMVPRAALLPMAELLVNA